MQIKLVEKASSSSCISHYCWRSSAVSVPTKSSHKTTATCTPTAFPRPSAPMRIAHVDDAVYANMLANMYRLLHVAQQTEEAPLPTRALLARKALRYRKLFVRAQTVDVDNSAFDVASFMGVTRIL